MKVEIIYGGLVADEILARYEKFATRFNMKRKDQVTVTVDIESAKDVFDLRSVFGCDLVITSFGPKNKNTIMILDEDTDEDI